MNIQKNKNIFKKIILLLLCTLSANAVEINKNKTFTIQSEQKHLKTTFRVSTNEKISSKIENTFHKIIKLSDKSNICTGGKYSIFPNYIYKNSKRIKNGYHGNVSFECTFKNKEKYSDLIYNIKKIQNILLTQNKINIIAKSKNKELEKKSFIYAKNYINELHNYFSNCMVKTIDFSNFQQSSPKPYYLSKNIERTENIKTSITLPIQKEITQSLHVNYTFTCAKLR